MQAPSLTKLVLEFLRNRIITGELAPGQRLNENELSSTLEVSRHPIREAFRVLEGEKLVFSVPNRGTFVTKLSAEDLIEVYQAREMIESYAIDLLELKNTTELPELESSIEIASRLSIPSGDDPQQYLELHKAFATFHIKMIEATGNSRLILFYNSIRLNLARYQFKNILRPGRIKIDNDEHRQILDLLKKANYAEAKYSLKLHVTKRLKDLDGTLYDIIN